VLTKLLLDLDTIGERLPSGALPRPLKFILEEFPALGNLSVVVEQANLVRKRRIAFLLATQTVGQLTRLYGRDGAATLLAGMATQIVFGGSDKETAEYFSSLAGNQTRILLTDKETKQQRVVERPLLTHDQIIAPPHAPQGNVIIFTRYVTATYAVNAVILARLTRLYERDDWKAAVAQVKTSNRKIKVYTRAIASRKHQRTIETPAERDTTLAFSPVTEQISTAVAEDVQRSSRQPQFRFLRVIDDSPPANEQVVVIPIPIDRKATDELNGNHR
jgi:type IV secretory pathway TraG/TraD family ATPase VirD4